MGISPRSSQEVAAWAGTGTLACDSHGLWRHTGPRTTVPATVTASEQSPAPGHTAAGERPEMGRSSSGRTASRGWQAQLPCTCTALLRRDGQGTHGPRDQLQEPDLGNTMLTGSPGHGHSPGTLSENTIVAATACPADAVQGIMGTASQATCLTPSSPEP